MINKETELSKNEYSRKYYSEHKDRMKEYRQRKREIKILGLREWRKRNPDYGKKTNINRAKQQAIIKDEAKKRGCIVCGLVDPSIPHIFDLHHVNPKDKKYCLNHNVAPSSLIEEIKKCVVVCANCHRKIHFGDAKGKDIEYWELERNTWTLGYGNYGTEYKQVSLNARPIDMSHLQRDNFRILETNESS